MDLEVEKWLDRKLWDSKYVADSCYEFACKFEYNNLSFHDNRLNKFSILKITDTLNRSFVAVHICMLAVRFCAENKYHWGRTSFQVKRDTCDETLRGFNSRKVSEVEVAQNYSDTRWKSAQFNSLDFDTQFQGITGDEGGESGWSFARALKCFFSTFSK